MKALQHSVALFISQAVVDVLELVDIKQRDRPVLRVGLFQYLPCVLEIFALASAAGERINVSHPARTECHGTYHNKNRSQYGDHTGNYPDEIITEEIPGIHSAAVPEHSGIRVDQCGIRAHDHQ